MNSAIAEARALLNDEDLKLHVYKKTLQAYLYPISSVAPHEFEVWTAKKPAYCYECEGLLWGLARQGQRCKNCGVKCHERCQDLINADCLQRAAAKSSHDGATVKTQSFIELIRHKMEEREMDKAKTFSMIRAVFNIPSERHTKHMKAGKQSVLDGTCKWSAKLIVTIIEAKGLQAKDKTGTSDPYVTVEVGKTKRRSKTIYNTLDPQWNEAYSFECHDSMDRLKIQVWDEDDDLKSKMKQKLLRESDDFLGHALILIHTLSGDMDCWYTLEKRTEKSVVSGTIHVKISVEIKGEEKCAPYRRQYTCLHENIFHHLMKANDNKVIMPDKRGVEQGWKLYFQTDAQDVINEFAMRYGIEPMYQAMTHFSCLATAYQSVGTRAAMADLLSNITKNFSEQKGNHKNKFEAANFGKEKFVKLLENLLSSLRLDLSMYRKNFPSTDNEKLNELKSCIILISEIGKFRAQVLDGKDETDVILSNCCKQCMQTTYGYVFENCNEMYAEMKSTSEAPPEETNEESTDSLEYWMRLLELMADTMEEDKGSYSPIFELTSGVVLCAVTCEEFWKLFCEDLQKVLSAQTQSHSNYTADDFMNLQFRVKGIYNEYPMKMSTKDKCPPFFYEYFEPYTANWLTDCGTNSLVIMEAAFVGDRNGGFKKNTDHSLFSSSIIDIFTQINESYKILSKLECSNESAQNNFLKKFSQNVDKVLIVYAKLVENTFGDADREVETACVLMNNLQEGRRLLEKLYCAMGGEKLKDDVRDVLNGTQNHLNDVLDKLAADFAKKYRKKLTESCISLSSLLRAIRGSGTASVAPQASVTPTPESNTILKPLMEILDGCLRVFAKSSEKTVLKRVLKELWKSTIILLEAVVVLPTVASEETEAGRFDASKNLSPKHCTVMETALHQIKDFFHASGNGLKRGFLDKSPELKKLTYALSLYTQTTDALIKLFVRDQTRQDCVDDSLVTGEINVQVDLFTHPGTGEHKVTVKVLAAELKWNDSSRFRPFIEVNMIGPYLANKRRRHSTSSKSGTLSPQYDDSFTFELSNEATLDIYEIQFIAKDYCFMREDRTIGIAVLQLREIVKQGSYSSWLTLVQSLLFDQTGKTVLRILSQRVGDNIAKEFVQIKTTVRSPDPA